MPTQRHTPLSRACTSEASAAQRVHAVQGRDLSPTAAPFLLQSSISKPGRMRAVHGHGLPAAMEGCAGHRPSSERSSRHTQGSVSTCLNRDSCCCRWHQFILPPRIPTALTVFSQEHPQGTSPQCESIPAPLPGPASLLPSLRAFITPWPGAQAKHGASSPLLDSEMQQRQPQHRAHGIRGSSATAPQHRPRVTTRRCGVGHRREGHC